MDSSDNPTPAGARAGTSPRAFDWSLIPVSEGNEDSIVLQASRRMQREPALLFTTAYLLVSALGLWCSYWFYRGFGVSILDYLQASDFLVAGVRDPVYIGLLLLGVLLVLLVTWPETLRLRNPDTVARLMGRNRLWRLLLGRSVFTSWEATRMRPLTAMTVAVTLFMAVAAAGYVSQRGDDIRDRRAGDTVTVHLIGDATALPGQARLLGTSSAFVFLWWPALRRAEAVPIAAVRRVQAAGVRRGAAPTPPARTAR